MKFDDFKKKENPFTKFLNKYFGMKYSVFFAISKQVLKEKPTATGLVSMVMVAHSIYIVFSESNYILYLIGAWAIAYAIQLMIKIEKRKKIVSRVLAYVKQLLIKTQKKIKKWKEK